MSPRVKSILTVTAVSASLIGILYIVSSTILLRGFAELEVRDTRQHVGRVLDALSEDLAQQDSTVADWAYWDDTYSFVQDLNADYVRSNLGNDTLATLKLNLMLFVNVSDRIVYAKAVELDSGKDAPLPENLQEFLSTNSLLPRPASLESSVTGIVLLPANPMLVASRSILTSERKGPSEGRLIFGRYLDSAEIERLGKITHLSFAVRRLDEGELPPDFQSARAALVKDSTVFVQPLDTETVAGYSFLRDIYGTSRLLLRVDVPRDIYRQGQASLNLLFWSLLGIGLLFGVISESLMERSILSRLASLESAERYRAVVEQTSEGICLVEANNKEILQANSACESLLGYAAGEMLGLTLYDIVSQDREAVDQDCRSVLAQRRYFFGERRYRRKDTSLVHVEVSGSRIVHAGQNVLCLVVRDVTERKRAETALRESEERYALATRGANDGLWDWDLKNGGIYYSSRWKAMLGYDDPEIGNNPDEWLTRVHPEDIDQLEAKISAHLQRLTHHFENEYRMLHKDGTHRWVLSRGLAVWDADGIAYRMAGSLTDFTERRLATEQLLLYDAFHDALTGLPNRALFLDRLGQALERAHRRQDYLFAVLFLDFDRFKMINDRLGHATGDQLLIDSTRRLETCLRSLDTVARLGGDEFVILVEDINDEGDATRVADRAQEELKLPFHLGGHDVFITASIGVVLSSVGYDRPEDILRDADTAMYRAKTLGRARYEVFHADMRSRAVASLELETDLRRAVERQEFRLQYQPIVSLATGKITGFEALVRWQHPALGLISPSGFIPAAEETGLIIPIGQWVLHQACRQMSQWQAQFPVDPPLTISVNLSGRQFTQPKLDQEIQQILEETGLAARCLRLEITESVIMEDAERTGVTLAHLKVMGVRFDIDDFGTGYSSLAYLQRLPFDAIKIDRSFVSRIGVEGYDSGIVEAIMALANNLGMQVIAEGVETRDQLGKLRALECHSGQGFLFSKPMDSEAVRALLAEELAASKQT